MPRVKIAVSQDDINAGEPGKPSLCPVALAWVRTYGGRAFVIGHGARFTDKTNWATGPVRLPAEAVDFILAFDAGKEVGPIEFQIAYPGKTGRI